MFTAERIADVIGTSLKEWGWSADEFAEFSGVPRQDLERLLNAGEAEAFVIDTVLTALGGTWEDVERNREFWKAPSLALRTNYADAQMPVLRAGILRVSAAGRDYQGLTRILGLPDLWEKRAGDLRPTAVGPDPIAQAEQLATNVRRVLKNPDGAIPSIRDALRSLGIGAFLTEIPSWSGDGFMLRDEGAPPIVAVNLSSRRRILPTSIRMILAHELCHALFDRPRRGASGIIEMRSERGGDREQRANAFAARFLAPRRALRNFLRDRGVTRRMKPTIRDLAASAVYFGVGVQTMANNFVNMGIWDDDDLNRHAHLKTEYYASTDDVELHQPTSASDVPIERRGLVLELASQALERDLISTARWRELLRLDQRSRWRELLSELQIDVDAEDESEG